MLKYSIIDKPTILINQQEVIDCIDFEIIIDNLTKYYQEQNVQAIERDFPLGSMQGNYTWSELNERFVQLRNLYPDIISDRLVIGQSLEGNDIWAFKLSDNPDPDCGDSFHVEVNGQQWYWDFYYHDELTWEDFDTGHNVTWDYVNGLSIEAGANASTAAVTWGGNSENLDLANNTTMGVLFLSLIHI